MSDDLPVVVGKVEWIKTFDDGVGHANWGTVGLAAGDSPLDRLTLMHRA